MSKNMSHVCKTDEKTETEILKFRAKTGKNLGVQFSCEKNDSEKFADNELKNGLLQKLVSKMQSNPYRFQGRSIRR